MSLLLDHIGLTCGSLATGAAEFEIRTGIAPGPGGTHPRMGTHNRLLNLGAGRYLELIAADPEADTPEMPRWFGLDALPADAPPALRFWMVSVPDLDAAIAAAAALGVDPGAAVEMSRGDLRWRLSIPASGALPFDGVAPILIEWPPGVHPTASMPDPVMTLARLDLTHPDADLLVRLLERLGGMPEGVTVAPGAAGLRAECKLGDGRTIVLE